MKRDDIKKILGEGATEEQITNLLNEFHNADKAKNDEIANLNSKLDKLSDYDNIKKQLDDINRANMTEQEKLEEMKKETERNLRESRITNNTAKAREILAGENVDEALLARLIDEDIDKTISNANLFKQTLSNLKDTVAKQTKETLTNVDLKPTMTNVNQTSDNAMTWEKFSKLSSEEQNKFATENPDEFKNL